VKTKTVWYCASCGHKQLRWTGQCPGCSEWNTLQEEQEISQKLTPYSLTPKKPQKPLRLKEITPNAEPRMSTGISELDRTLGGGLVVGSFTLIGGEPGIGKSTISLQLAHHMAQKKHVVLYVCGEESLEQTSLRCARLSVFAEHILFLNETDLSVIIQHIDALCPHVVIIDSIQIVYKPELSSSPGSVSQVREAASTLMQVAKSKNIATILIGHVTKSGDIAGPKVLEHLVDTVLYFEGDKHLNLRSLRIFKNRFGPTDEMAVFQMKQEGLVEIKNPSEMFLEERMRGQIGSCIIPTMEGTRSILIEIQALVTDTFYSTASRRSTGVDSNRLALLIAVLEKKARLKLHASDIFVSVTGGIKIQEPAADLGVLLSIASSFSNHPIDPDTLVIGEVGLGGEVRAVGQIENRLKEGIKMGFTRVILPKKHIPSLPVNISSSISLNGISWVDEAIDALFRK